MICIKDIDVIQHIKDLCAERNWTYYKLAKEAELPYSTISNMLHRGNIPSVPTLQKMCNGFGISLTSFFHPDMENVCLTEDQQEVINIFNKLSLEERKQFIAYGMGLANILK